MMLLFLATNIKESERRTTQYKTCDPKDNYTIRIMLLDQAVYESRGIKQPIIHQLLIACFFMNQPSKFACISTITGSKFHI